MSEQVDKHILNQYQILRKIGSGAYGHVFKVTNRVTHQKKALKKNFDAFNNSTDAQRTYRQIMFLLQLSHPNIINLQQVIRAQNDKDIYLVFEYMDIDLYTLIRQNILQDKHRKFILYQVVKAIYYLHSAALIHRDIKPSNILVNENCATKLCDFGLVRSVDQNSGDNSEILTEYIATRWYRSPELLLGSRNYSKAIDIWSIGCLIGQMIKGKPLFPGTSTINQIERVLAWTGTPSKSDIESIYPKAGRQLLQTLSKVKKINPNQLFNFISPQCLDLINKTLQFNPDKRITIQEVIQHPYFSQLYNPKDILKADRKIKISVDDNRRLPLRDYRQLIYQQIKNRYLNKSIDKQTNIDNTLFRIRDKHQKTIKTESEEPRNIQNKGVGKNSRTISIKRSVNYSKLKAYQNVDSHNSKNLKTVGNEWDYVETKKAIILKQSKKLKDIPKKKSMTQVDHKLNKNFPKKNIL